MINLIFPNMSTKWRFSSSLIKFGGGQVKNGANYHGMTLFYYFFQMVSQGYTTYLIYSPPPHFCLNWKGKNLNEDFRIREKSVKRRKKERKGKKVKREKRKNLKKEKKLGKGDKDMYIYNYGKVYWTDTSIRNKIFDIFLIS